jgi:hypothetical protein
LRKTPVRVMGGGMEWAKQQYVDPPLYRDIGRIGIDGIARATALAGIGVQDIDVFELYDANDFEIIRQLEVFGLCGEGEGGDLVAERGIGVEPGQPVWEIWRKRSLGSDDSILERAVLPLSRVPAIDRERLAAGESLYRFIQERYSITDDYTEQAFEVDTPNNWEAKHLRIAPTDPIVRVRGVSFDTEGRAFDCFEQCYRATKFTFYTAGQTRHRILGPAEMANWSVTALTGQDG